jgi:4-hydroxy-tetrahydrodipicolinate synthase
MKTVEELILGGLNPAHMMPGTGACSVHDAVAMTRVAVKAKCAGVLMLPPFYYKEISDDGLFAFFAEVIEQVGDANLKIYAYNIPPITKITMSLALLERLFKTYPSTVIGIKDSSNDWPYTESVIKALAPGGFRVYAGSEAYMLRTIQAGGLGCISSLCNVQPKEIAELAAHWQASDAPQRDQALNKIRSIFAQFPMIPALKAATAHYSKDPNWARVRPPLMSLTSDQQKKLIADLNQVNFSMPGL